MTWSAGIAVAALVVVVLGTLWLWCRQFHTKGDLDDRFYPGNGDEGARFAGGLRGAVSWDASDCRPADVARFLEAARVHLEEIEE